jgi:NADH-quinone oxidoreductase subunit E
MLPALRLHRRSTATSRRTRCASAPSARHDARVCEAVASFYDMLHLKPVGRHMVEVCTNVSCALVGAQQVLERFEQELGVSAGETTATARSPCARSSASAAAAGRRSCRSTTTTART